MTADPLLALPAADLAARVRSGDVSAVDVVEAALRRIEERRGGNAFVTVTADHALRRAAGRPTGPLAGVPLAVKDLFDTRGIRTTYGSSIFRDHVPARTANAVRTLEAAGAIMVGKTNLHEFAWGVTSQNPHWGTVANPTRPGRVAGGSSGGTAAALADGSAIIGLGTDTGGSLRIPAACCDVVGFKPAFGAVPIHGTFPLAPTFDTVGPMARTVRDCALVYGVLTGRPVPAPGFGGFRVGLLAPTGAEGDLAALGAVLLEVALPVPTAGDPTAVFVAECAITHVPWFPRLAASYGADVRTKLEAAQSMTVVEHYRGVRALHEYRERAAELDVDLIVSPTMAIEPPADDVWELDVRVPMTRWTRPFNFLGWPAIAVGGIQFAGPDERTVLAAALAWEEAHPGTG